MQGKMEHRAYWVELHCHTSETSFCSTVRGKELVELYKAKKYDAMVVTDHYYDGYFNWLKEMSWNEKVDRFLAGYRNAKAHGDKIGMSVILGIELRFTDHFNDYLVFGLTERMLYDYPRLYDYSIEKFSAFAKEHRLLWIQAHPFRDGMVNVDYAYLDGIEIYNAHPEHNSRNDVAERTYRMQHQKRPSFIATAESDCHNVSHEGRAGILSSKLPQDGAELVSLLRSGDYEIYTSVSPC